MAFQPKYVFELTTVRAPLRVTLLEDGWTGAASPLRLADNPVEDQTSKSGSHELTPLRPRIATLRLHPSETAVADEIYGGDADWRVHIEEQWQGAWGTSLVGPIQKQLRTSSDDVYPTAPIEVKMNCGLGSLQEIPFTEATTKTTRRSIIGWITHLLRKTGLGLGVYARSEWEADFTGAAAHALEREWLGAGRYTDDDGQPLYCFDVLKDLVAGKGMFLVQEGGSWHCYQRSAYRNASFGRYFYPSSWTDADASPTAQTFDAWVDVDASNPTTRMKGSKRPMREAESAVEVTYSHRTIKNLLPAWYIRVPDRDPVTGLYSWDYNELWSNPTSYETEPWMLSIGPDFTVDDLDVEIDLIASPDEQAYRGWLSIPKVDFDDTKTVSQLLQSPVSMQDGVELESTWNAVRMDIDTWWRFSRERLDTAGHPDASPYAALLYAKVILDAEDGSTYYLRRNVTTSEGAYEYTEPDWTTDSTSFAAFILEGTTGRSTSTVSIVSPELPADGRVRVELYGIIDPEPDRYTDTANGLDTYFGRLRLPRMLPASLVQEGDQPSEQIITAQRGDRDVEKPHKIEVLHGTGPTAAHPSATWTQQESGDLVDGWGLAAAGDLTAGKMLAREVLYQLAELRDVVQWTMRTTERPSAIRAVHFTSTGGTYLPLHLKRKYLSGHVSIEAPKVDRPTPQVSFLARTSSSSSGSGASSGTGGSGGSGASAGVTSFEGRTGPVSLRPSDVTGALGFTPRDAADPLVESFNTRTGDVTLQDADVTDALGYTPLDPSANETITGGYTFTSNVAMDRLIFGDTGAGANDVKVSFGNGYDVFQDGYGSGLDDTRLWFDAPDGGEMILGPRVTAEELHRIRLRANEVKVEGSVRVRDNLIAGADAGPYGDADLTVRAAGSYGLVVKGTAGSLIQARNDGGDSVLNVRDISTGAVESPSMRTGKLYFEEAQNQIRFQIPNADQIYWMRKPSDGVEFAVYNANLGKWRLGVNGSGMAVGKANPTARLDVVGDAKFDLPNGGTLHIDDSLGGSGSVDFLNNAGDLRFSADNDGTQGNIRFYTAGQTERVVISGSGDVKFNETIHSPNAQAGFGGSGTIIDRTDSWFDNITVRGSLLAYEFEARKITTSRGPLAVSPGGGKIESIEDLGGGDYRLYFAEAPGIGGGDILLIKEIDASGKSVAIASEAFFYVYDADGSNDSVRVDFRFSSPAVGSAQELIDLFEGSDCAVVGNTSDANRDSLLYLDPYIPALDVLDGIKSKSDWENRSPQVRLGRLDGINSGDLNPSGYGLYAENAFLKGEIVADSGHVGGWRIANGSIYKDNNGVRLALGSNENGVPWATSVRGLQIGHNQSNRMWFGNIGDTYDMRVVKNGDNYVRLGSVENKIAGWNLTPDIFTKTLGSYDIELGEFVGSHVGLQVSSNSGNDRRIRMNSHPNGGVELIAIDKTQDSYVAIGAQNWKRPSNDFGITIQNAGNTVFETQAGAVTQMNHVDILGNVTIDGNVRIGDSNNERFTYSNISSDGWYRIAKVSGRSKGRFKLWDTQGGRHNFVEFTIGVQFGDQNRASFQLHAATNYANNQVIQKVRLVTGGIYDDMYLQVYLGNTNSDYDLNVQISDNEHGANGWTRSIAGSGYPSGYVTREWTISPEHVVDEALNRLTWGSQDYTEIDGGTIRTGTVIADAINTNDLFSQNLTVTGTVGIDAAGSIDLGDTEMRSEGIIVDSNASPSDGIGVKAYAGGNTSNPLKWAMTGSGGTMLNQASGDIIHTAGGDVKLASQSGMVRSNAGMDLFRTDTGNHDSKRLIFGGYQNDGTSTPPYQEIRVYATFANSVAQLWMKNPETGDTHLIGTVDLPTDGSGSQEPDDGSGVSDGGAGDSDIRF